VEEEKVDRESTISDCSKVHPHWARAMEGAWAEEVVGELVEEGVEEPVSKMAEVGAEVLEVGISKN